MALYLLRGSLGDFSAVESFDTELERSPRPPKQCLQLQVAKQKGLSSCQGMPENLCTGNCKTFASAPRSFCLETVTVLWHRKRAEKVRIGQ